MHNLDFARAGQAAAQIPKHGPDGFAGMRAAGQLAAQCLDMLVPYIKPGITTDRIDQLVLDFALAHKALPATLFYRGYKRSVCTSINHVVCHGIPNNKPLRDGDILNIDVTLIVDGWHGDTSRMFTVGSVARRSERLIDVTYEALLRGVAAVKPGGNTGDIGAAIQAYAESERYSVVEEFCGHGVGKVFHLPPNIVHYRINRAGEDQGPGVAFEPGMIFTIEPMINVGRPDVKVLADGWTAVTRDRSLSAQFEHSVGVTDTGVEVFTVSPSGHHKPPYRV